MSDERVSFRVVDLNRDPPEVLEQLPGVGPALARRIVEARPFTTPEDLVRVSGIGPVLLERLRPYLTVSPLEGAEEEDVVEETAGPVTKPEDEGAEPPSETVAADLSVSTVQAEMGTPSPVMESVKESSAVAPPVLPLEAEGSGESVSVKTPSQRGMPEAGAPATAEAEKPVTRRDLTTWVVGGNLITLFLALLLALLFLGLINGTLRFVSMAQFRQFQAETALLSERVDRLESNLEAVRTRVDALEGLSSRVSGLENETATLKSALDEAQADIRAIQTLVKGFDQRLAAVEATSARFERFLEGLRQLLTETQAPTEGGP
ncbi:helix-hairpin-helix domain-containing protein [uncultured Thermanaerothrix sp.]|uniref:ComEA family DNA-binding protein n=1 Tax=uncultured Thermanaerothrix sp. TaxID=1195149 RepID=UPI0026242005|nr:helix-hairpin-helix domain-containing protein [uncultured Thermanaerothrix sp.]